MSCNNAACLDPSAAEYCALTSSQTSFGFGEVIERAELDRDCCTNRKEIVQQLQKLCRIEVFL